MKNSHFNIEIKKLAKLAALICAWLLFVLTGCEKKTNAGAVTGGQSGSEKPKLTVVATIFPLYDWTKNLLESVPEAKVELLVKNGVDLHSFQPSAGDMVKIGTADILIYVGGQSDGWVRDAVKNASNKNLVALSLMDLLKDKVAAEELVEGMQSEAEEPAAAGADLDEHVWLSVSNAKLCCKEIAAILTEKLPAESRLINSNLAAYTQNLDSIWASCVTRDRKTIVVCDRFPFRYMAEELGLLYYAAFPGCSAETEASFETVAFLSNKLKELGLNKVYVTESSDQKLARTVIKNAGLSEKDCRILVLDSMQSTTLDQAKAGKNYVDVMKNNFSLVSEANK